MLALVPLLWIQLLASLLHRHSEHLEGTLGSAKGYFSSSANQEILLGKITANGLTSDSSLMNIKPENFSVI